MSTPVTRILITAFDAHKEALSTDDMKSSHEEWNLYTVLNDNISTFNGFITLLGKLEDDLKKLPSLPIEAASATSTGTLASAGAAAAATTKIDTKSPAEQYKIMGQTIRAEIFNKMPCFGALGSHLSMAFHQSNQEGAFPFESIWGQVMTALDKLILKAVKMKHGHEAIKTSKEGSLMLEALERISKDASNMVQFLETQAPNRKVMVPSESTAAAKISG